ncbi:MAG: hypothetical protein QOC73_248 [Actinomycetota bacterium]|nr:hypothetical protein [Actinomycetota bacterium]
MTFGRDATPYKSFDEFLVDLEAIDWSVGIGPHQGVEALLRRLHRDRTALKERVRSWKPGGERRISRETSTHYKWFVHEDQDQRFTLWLHEYKPAGVRGTRHAVIPHNHRYWFSSLMLAGGFTSTSFRARVGRPGVIPADRLSVAAGDVFTIPPDEIHALEAIEDGTLTLIVQGRPVRNYSEVYEPETGKTTRFYDMVARLPELQDRVT